MADAIRLSNSIAKTGCGMGYGVASIASGTFHAVARVGLAAGLAEGAFDASGATESAESLDVGDTPFSPLEAEASREDLKVCPAAGEF